MNTTTKRLLFGLITPTVISAFFWAHPTPLHAQGGTEQGLSFDFQITRREFMVGQPVLIRFTATNTSPERKSFNLGTDERGNFVFSIRNRTGTVAGDLRYTRGGFDSGHLVVLNGGEQFEKILILGEWYEFKSPGTYNVNCRLVSKQGVISEKQLAVVISPLDRVKLSKLCADAYDEWSKAKDPREKQRLGNEIAHFRDPSALLCLTVAAENGCEPAITGLRKIGGKEAEASLVRLTKSRDETIANKARYELDLLRKGIEGDLEITD